MVLKHLEIKRFKCWLSLSVDFAPGLNVITGPNESGKSTLRAALMAVLFGNPTSVSEAVDRWTSWAQPERCELKLEYTNQAGLPCQLRKDFSEHKVFLIKGEEQFKTAKVIQQEITDDLGISSEEFYALCASLDSKTLSDLGQARKQVGKMLAGLMTGAESGSDVLQAIKRLDEDLKELNKGLTSPSKTPGPLKACRERLTQLTADSHQLETEIESRRVREQKSTDLNLKVNAGLENLKNLEQVLAVNRKLTETRKRHEELAKQDQGFEQLKLKQERLERERSELQARLAADAASCLTPSDWEEVRAHLARASQLALDNPLPGETKKPEPVSWLWPAGVGLAGLGMLLVWKWTGMGLLALTAGLFAIFLGWQQRLSRQASTQARDEALRQIQQKNQALLQERQAWLARTGLTPETLLQALPACQKFAQEMAALERSLREIEPVDEAQWKIVRRELRLAQDVLEDPALTMLLLKPQEVAQKERERQILSDQVEEQRRERDRLQAILDHVALHQDGLAELEEKIAETRERLSYLEQQAHVGQLAGEGLEQARRATLHPARQILENEAGSLLGMISRERYTQVSVDDEDLACRVFIPDTQRWEDPGVLSQGTFDQFYLSLRLALGDILAGGKKPPLLLDDPFSAFDADRQARFLDWLKIRSRQQQVLIFTCRQDYAPYAEKVIELESLKEIQAREGKKGR